MRRPLVGARVRARAAILAGCASAGCGGQVSELPPLAEVEVSVDTDMPVPRLASRLRVDAYTTPDHRWVASRDFLRASPSDWPASFVIAAKDPDRGGAMLVRVRAYLDGKLRDYRGERYMDAPPQGDPHATAPLPLGDGEPRLRDERGQDVTPLTEPQPLLAIDRLVRVVAVAGAKQRVSVVLHGECLGVMADITGERTCDADPALRVSPDVPHVPRAGDDLGPSVNGTFVADEACTLPVRRESRAADGTRLFDDEVCVARGLFVLGWPQFGAGYRSQAGEPERMARLPAFRIDRNEVTVGRWRRALAEGFHPPIAPASNDLPLPKDAASFPNHDPFRSFQCTYSSAPMGRETYPMTCVHWASARAFCRFYGGDLPLEAQWAYVASAASRPRATPYAWGGLDTDYAPCSRGVFARTLPSDEESGDACVANGFGPQPVDAAIGPSGDVSLGLGLANLGGSAREWMRDDAAPFDSICWMRNGLDSPHCDDPAAHGKSIRGGSWRTAPREVVAAYRFDVDTSGTEIDVGFRCVREAP